jgi:tetratricopeptide (TPR) repeat protein
MTTVGSEALVGRTLGHYRLLEVVGAGGMGVVYRAHDERLDRIVAVKVIAPALLADERTRTRFRAEALALSKLNHPNVETIHDFDRHGGLDLLVAEYVPGATLAERLREGPLAERDAIRLGTQLARGLAAVHDQGIVHRDVKPGNLRVTPDRRLKILDFGVARSLRGVAHDDPTSLATEAVGERPGTPRYMSPERFRGAPADVRGDVYSAGAVLYEMATGTAPVRGEDVGDLARNILAVEPEPPRTVNPQVSEAFERIILKALDKDPERRYQSAAELAVDLERLGPRPTGPLRVPGRRALAVTLGAAAVLVALGAVAWMAAPWMPGRSGQDFTPRGWVLISDFVGCAGGAETCDALREALTIALEQSRFLNVLPRQRVIEALQRMERPPEAAIDEATGLQLCRRERAQVLLSGRVATEQGGTFVTVRALAHDGRLVFTVRETTSRPEDAIRKVDALSNRVRRELGESGAQVDASLPLEQVTTRSTAALERYSRAVDLLARGRVADAKAALLAAAELDPEFAMVHQELADVYNRTGEPLRESEHVQRAYALRGKLTDRERLTIEGAYHSSREDYERAVESLQALVGLYPDDPVARRNLALALMAVGRSGDAIGELRRTLQLEPHASRAASALVLLLAEVGENDEALATFEQVGARGLVTPTLQWGRAMALMGKGEAGLARQELQRLAMGPEESYRSIGQLYLTRLEIVEGHRREAREELARAARADRVAGRAYPERHRRYLLGRLLLLDGDWAGALRQARELTAGAVAPTVHEWFGAGHIQLLAGDVAAAGVTLERLRATLPDPPGAFGRSRVLLLEAGIAAATGREETGELYRQAAAAFPSYFANVGLAEWLESREDWREALEEWGRVLDARGEILRYGFPADWVLAHARTARVALRLGDVARARRAFEQALTTWKDGDSDRLQAGLRREWQVLGGRDAAPAATRGEGGPAAPAGGREERRW